MRVGLCRVSSYLGMTQSSRIKQQVSFVSDGLFSRQPMKCKHNRSGVVEILSFLFLDRPAAFSTL